MMSPSFECSREGLRSAVRLRAVVMGRPDPEAIADQYLRDQGMLAAHPEGIRGLIEVVIEDIEHLTSAYPDGLTDDGL